MVDPGTFILYDAVRPALDDGDYTLAIQQSITDTSGATTIPAVPPGSFSFRVTGPRFALPPDQLLSQFPPPDSQGDYSAGCRRSSCSAAPCPTSGRSLAQPTTRRRRHPGWR